MNASPHTEGDLIAAQLGRAPRTPWRVATRCDLGFPTTIVSPSRLDDGSPFPNLAWLTCPWLAERAYAEESAGATALWSAQLAASSRLAERLQALDEAVRAARAAESGGVDACAEVGIAGQSDPLGVKCVHAHVALALAGFDDPIGEDLLGRVEMPCPDRRCEAYQPHERE